MLLKQLMQFEEKLLLCEYKEKFTMPFSDYVTLDKFLTDVEMITDLYFGLMKKYKDQLAKDGVENEEQMIKMDEFNHKILNEDIEFDFNPYNSFIEKYIEKK
jgi:hypothetical protein